MAAHLDGSREEIKGLTAAPGLEHNMNIKNETGSRTMLQIFTMMFFSLAAFAGIAILSEMLIGSWPEVKRALRAQEATLPRPVPTRIRMVRWTRQSPVRPTLRAAA